MSRRAVSIGLAAFFGFYLFIGFSGGEAFPFSTFPMYSVARLDPYVIPSQRIFAYTASGEEHAIGHQTIRSRVRAMRRAIVLEEVDAAGIEAFTGDLLRMINALELTPEPATGLRVMELRLQIPPRGTGDPLEAVVVSSVVLIDAAPENARVSPAARPHDGQPEAA